MAASADAGTAPAPEPYFDRQAGKWMVEDANGVELEWDTGRNAWVPVVRPSPQALASPLQPC